MKNVWNFDMCYFQFNFEFFSSIQCENRYRPNEYSQVKFLSDCDNFIALSVSLIKSPSFFLALTATTASSPQ